MKILWITNILFPEAEELLLGKGELRGSGGWMVASAEALVKQEGVELFVATVSTYVRKFEIIKGAQITHCIMPYGKGNKVYNSEYEVYWKQVRDFVHPDVIHIHGTEYTHGLAYINSCGSENVIISVQGLISGIAPYYCAGLSCFDIYRNITFHDIIKGSIYRQQRAFYKAGELEKLAISKVQHIIGRTSWDRAHILAINPNVNYYVCNETLRDVFYNGPKWSYSNCIPHTIFLSQGGYPLKGLHQVLKAMPFILKHHPDASIRIAGDNIINKKGLYGIIHFTGYGKIIKRLIDSLELKNIVTFLGPLNAEQMKVEYLKSNVFICPSSIENSPNSLGEAQILGVPSIASYVGGIPDFMKMSNDYLYRFEEYEILSEKVVKIFNTSSSFNGEDVVCMANQRHDQSQNLRTLISIYSSILNH